MDKKWYYLIGGGILLWLLARKGKGDCPLPTVLFWSSVAEKAGRGRLTVPQILAVIHDQSMGNPNQIYYVGGIWPRYGLMGVPLAWAQEVGFTGKASELMKPEINIEYGAKILLYMDCIIAKAYAAGGVHLSYQYQPSMSANAYSWYANGQQLQISGMNDPIIHEPNTIKRIRNLLACYRKEVS